MKKIIILFFMCFISFNTYALTSGFIPIEVLDVNGSSAGSRSVGVTYKATAVNGSSIFGYRKVALSSSSVLNQIKKVGKFPFTPIAVALAVAGYLYDEFTDDFVVAGYESLSESALGSCTTFRASGAYTNSWQSLTYSDCEMVRSQNHYQPATMIWTHNGVSYTQEQSPAFAPAISDEVALDVYDALSPEEQIEVWTDPDTLRVASDVPEINTIGDDLTLDYEAENDSDPLTVPTVDPLTGDTGTSSTGSEPIKQTSMAESECVTNPNSIACWESGDELIADDILTQEITFDYSPVSLSSNDSCPAPSSFMISDTPVSISFQPLCDFGSGLKYLIMAIAAFTGAYIIVGGVKQ